MRVHIHVCTRTHTHAHTYYLHLVLDYVQGLLLFIRIRRLLSWRLHPSSEKHNRTDGSSQWSRSWATEACLYPGPSVGCAGSYRAQPSCMASSFGPFSHYEGFRALLFFFWGPAVFFEGCCCPCDPLSLEASMRCLVCFVQPLRKVWGPGALSGHRVRADCVVRAGAVPSGCEVAVLHTGTRGCFYSPPARVVSSHPLSELRFPHLPTLSGPAIGGVGWKTHKLWTQVYLKDYNTWSLCSQGAKRLKCL